MLFNPNYLPTTGSPFSLPDALHNTAQPVKIVWQVWELGYKDCYGRNISTNDYHLGYQEFSLKKLSRELIQKFIREDRGAAIAKVQLFNEVVVLELNAEIQQSETFPFEDARSILLIYFNSDAEKHFPVQAFDRKHLGPHRTIDWAAATDRHLLPFDDFDDWVFGVITFAARPLFPAYRPPFLEETDTSSNSSSESDIDWDPESGDDPTDEEEIDEIRIFPGFVHPGQIYCVDESDTE
jgi:hypothetical protein